MNMQMITGFVLQGVWAHTHTRGADKIISLLGCDMKQDNTVCRRSQRFTYISKSSVIVIVYCTYLIN